MTPSVFQHGVGFFFKLIPPLFVAFSCGGDFRFTFIQYRQIKWLNATQNFVENQVSIVGIGAKIVWRMISRNFDSELDLKIQFFRLFGLATQRQRSCMILRILDLIKTRRMIQTRPS